MRRLMLLSAVAVVATGATLMADSWPNWRGPSLDGVSSETGLPTTWSATQNVAWNLPLPAFSGATPVIWNDYVFLNVATARSTGQIELWTVDRRTEEVVWTRPISFENRMGNKQNMSSPSPVTDGDRVWAMSGTGVIRAFRFDGQEVWARDLQADYGRFGLQYGYGSSPLLHDDDLFVQVLHGFFTDDPSYLIRIDGDTGETVWRTERATPAVRESPDSYTTPTILERGGRTIIITTGGDVVTGHDAGSGQELWRADVLNPRREGNFRIIASPVVAGGLIIAPTRVRPLVALRPDAEGLVSASDVAWTFPRGPDVPTPVSDGTLLYVVSEQGIVYCLDLLTGQPVYGPVRLPPDFYSASPLLADGKIYVTGESTGVTTVFRAGREFEILASNTFGDPCAPYCLSSVVPSEGQLFIRTDAHLWVVGERRPTADR